MTEILLTNKIHWNKFAMRVYLSLLILCRNKVSSLFILLYLCYTNVALVNKCTNQKVKRILSESTDCNALVEEKLDVSGGKVSSGQSVTI